MEGCSWPNIWADLASFAPVEALARGVANRQNHGRRRQPELREINRQLVWRRPGLAVAVKVIQTPLSIFCTETH
jgi:hypothetical protein